MLSSDRPTASSRAAGGGRILRALMNARNDVLSHFAADSEEVQQAAFCFAAKTSSLHSARFVPNQLTYSMVLCMIDFFMQDLPFRQDSCRLRSYDLVQLGAHLCASSSSVNL
jgi:hypothetical protein